ncbi:MAG: response regulator [Hyphomicrobiales bacterium]|nr:MAG: response regulator [Hyphomicrobiales bacterium]
MTHHLAYGLSTQDLDIVVVEDSKPMQTVMRSILAPMRPTRIRVYDSAESALQAMIQDPPNLIITDYRLGQVSGYGLLRTIRQQHMQPLSFVPVIFVTAHATRELVEKTLRGGAQHLLVKPLAPARLQQCIQWLLEDDRIMLSDEEGSIHVDGVERKLDQDRERWQTAERARAYHRHMDKLAEEFQVEVDTIISDPEREDGDIPAPMPEPLPMVAEEPEQPADIEPETVEPPPARAPTFAPVRPRAPTSDFADVVRRCRQVSQTGQGAA